MGFNRWDKINKKSRYFFVIYNSGIWIWVLIQGIKYMGLVVRHVTSSNIEIWMYECSTKCFYWKRIANVLTRPVGRKRILINNFVIRNDFIFAYDKILCATGHRVYLGD